MFFVEFSIQYYFYIIRYILYINILVNQFRYILTYILMLVVLFIISLHKIDILFFYK